ncbi:MAG: radical SAM protein [Thermoanaerobaculia bacterium]|nr:radical SAM protein [Thermoanaerobaculia bacterium]
MSILAASSVPVAASFPPAECPFETVIVDVTHRCNMSCLNCYLPNRTIPDMDAAWLDNILAELPRGRFVRLMGAEATVRHDLPELIATVRRHGHHAVIVTNGLRLADRSYVRELKRAGLQITSLSFNGGFDDDLYEAIDSLRCASKKVQALENLVAENMFTSLGVILVRGVNEREVLPIVEYARSKRPVREIHFRSIGAMGRHMDNPPFTLEEMMALFCAAAGSDSSLIKRHERTATSYDFQFERLRIQVTVWPDLNNSMRGRLTPEGMIAPFMEHAIANDGGY